MSNRFAITVAVLIGILNPGWAGAALREVVVSHTDDQGILQLYRMKEDGTDSRQLTFSKTGCRMPSCSPDGKKLAYVEQLGGGLALRVADLDGRNARTMVADGMNLLPTWLPDSSHLIWMKVSPQPKQDPARNSKLFIMNLSTGEHRRLFTNPEQRKHSNAMPTISPNGKRIAFISDRSGDMRLWVSDLNGDGARLLSKPEQERHEIIKAPIEQKVPVWSPDGKWIAHWEGVEMIHMSQFTGIPNPERDRQIAATFHVWIVSSDGKRRRKVGRGDDPTWSPDGFVTRAYPEPRRGGPLVMVGTKTAEKAMPIVPPRRNWGRFDWVPNTP